MGYNKGTRRENELGGLLSDNGYEAWMRAPGSGTANRELPDVIAGKDGHTLVFEAKAWSNKKKDGSEKKYGYVKKQEVDDLEYFARNFGAEWFVAYRFDYNDWKFVKRDQMIETKKNFRCEKDINTRSLQDICK